MRSLRDCALRIVIRICARLQVFADGGAEAGVEEGYRHQCGAEDDEGHEAVGGGELPDVNEDNFGDADEEQTETGEAEAAFADDEGEEEGAKAEETPSDGDMAGGELGGEGDDHQREWREEEPLLGSAEGADQGFDSLNVRALPKLLTADFECEGEGGEQ